MRPNTPTKPYSDYEMMMLREGWNPRCALIEREIARLERGHTAHHWLTCEICARIAALLRSVASSLEKVAARNEPA